MAKITRANHKTFGVSGSSDNFAKFGSLVAAAPIKSKDLATIQSLPAWDNGFQDAIYGANKDILLEDLNAFCFEHSTQLSYLFQAGIPEWETASVYQKGSFVQRTSGSDATGQVYISLIDANAGNAPPAAASNANWLWVNPPAVIAGATATLNTIPKVSSTSPANGVPGSKSLADSNISDDGSNVILAVPLKFADATIQSTAAINTAVAAQNVVTGSRSLGTVFHNAGAKPLFVCASVEVSTTVASVYSDAANPPTTIIAKAGTATQGPLPDSYVAAIFFVVLPGNYYKIGGGMSLFVWTEWS